MKFLENLVLWFEINKKYFKNYVIVKGAMIQNWLKYLKNSLNKLKIRTHWLLKIIKKTQHLLKKKLQDIIMKIQCT